MRIVCASSVLRGEEAFSLLGETRVLPEREITRAVLRDADALVIRSRTKVTRELLEGTSVRFVGTATAGVDHLDLDYMEREGIAWANAPGCNANSVAEYVVGALLCLAKQNDLSLTRMTLGVIGVGYVGSRVVRLAECLGITVLQNDPPRFAATRDPVFCPLNDVLDHADVVTLHVPLTQGGRFPTFHMADCRFFAKPQPGYVFINTSRGEVMDSDAFLLAVERHAVTHAVLDVWEKEPYYRRDVLDAADLGTAHIAGHSVDGKLEGTRLVYRELCHFFEVEPTWQARDAGSPPLVEVDADARGRHDEDVLWQIVSAVYDVRRDDQALRATPEADDNAAGSGLCETSRRVSRTPRIRQRACAIDARKRRAQNQGGWTRLQPGRRLKQAGRR